MKKIRLRFSAEIYIKAENIQEAREKWEGMQLFSQEALECEAEFIDFESIEDAETYKDISEEWDADPDEYEAESPELDKAIDYIRENMDEDDMAILKANMSKCYKAHLIPDDNVMDCDVVIDLLNEYGEENGLEEDWWEDYEMSDILEKL